MKELFTKLNRIELRKCPKNLVLIDTCFFISTFDNNKHKLFEEFCEQHNVAMTSFNVEEVVYNIHRFRDKTTEYIRHFLKRNNKMSILDIAVSPGSRNHEVEYVNTVDDELLQYVHDPSDAVLVATAIRTGATILTKDKHHLFTSQLRNFLNKYDLKVYKELKDLFE